MDKHFLIYKITNTLNNKIYIGKHKTSDKDDGYMGSGKILKRSQDKYGIDKFIKEILFECSSEEEMNTLERELVDEEFIARFDTYNITLGGDGGFHHCNSTGLNIYDGHSEQAKINLNNHQKSTDTLMKKLEDAEYNEEFKRKVSNGVKLYQKYNGHPWSGRQHNDESKRKIGEANSKHQKGEGNSQYGTCWIHSLTLKESKRIDKNNLNDWTSKGWIKGRKMKF